jgi:hypothetical protein
LKNIKILFYIKKIFSLLKYIIESLDIFYIIIDDDFFLHLFYKINQWENTGLNIEKIKFDIGLRCNVVVDKINTVPIIQKCIIVITI